MSDFFLDIWTFAISQLGLVCVGILIGSWGGRSLRRDLINLLNPGNPGNPGTQKAAASDKPAAQE